MSSANISAARTWIDVAEDFKYPTLLLAYETLRLLIQRPTTLLSLPQHPNILKNSTSSIVVDTFAACLRNHAPAPAVEFLEQRCGVFGGHCFRSLLHDVIESRSAGKAFANQFIQLAQHIALCSMRLVQISMNDCAISTWKSWLIFASNLVSPVSFFPRSSPVFNARQVGALSLSKNSSHALVVSPAQGPVRKDVRNLSTELGALIGRSRRADATREVAFLRTFSISWISCRRPPVENKVCLYETAAGWEIELSNPGQQMEVRCSRPRSTVISLTT